MKNKLRHHLLLTSLACAVAFAPVRAQTVGLPALGDGESISLSAERQLGDRIARELYRDPDFLEDPVLDEYIQQLWAPLIKAAAARGDLSPELQERFAWRILLGRDRTVNAFALPGGYLGVHLGLIAVVSSHDELASVLAHELSHVTQRHIARGMDDQAKMTPWVIGSMILGALAASKSAQGAQALIVGGQAAAAQSQLSYSRDMEREADRVGYGILLDAGYDPKGFVGMFAKLQQAAGLNDSGAFPYLRSHPLTTERLADMQARQQLNASTVSQSNDLAQAMLAARARVLAQSTPDALRAWTLDAQPGAKPASAAQQVGALYAATLAHVQMRNMDGAERTLASLTEQVAKAPNNKGPQGLLQALPDMAASRWLRLLRAEVAFKQNRFEAVLTTLVPDGALVKLPRPELLAVAQALQRLPKHPWLDDATRQLRLLVLRSPVDAQAWQILAGLLSLQGAALGALRAEGEAQIARLDWTGAVDRLRAAQDRARQGRLQPGDHIEASIVDARLRYAQDRLREMQVQRQ